MSPDETLRALGSVGASSLATARSRSTSDNNVGASIVPCEVTRKSAAVGDNIHAGTFSRKPAGSTSVTAPSL
jgi:hypothetical protein